MIKKLLTGVAIALICCMFTATAFAAPYQNYNFNKGWVTAEPQAYTPYKIIDAVTMGVQTGENSQGMLNPSDMAASTVNGDIAIADTGNSRIIIIDKKYQLKQYISTKMESVKTVLVVDENGEPLLDENGNLQYTQETTDITGFMYNGQRYRLSSPEGLTFNNAGQLYVCDTGNGRIVRFTLDESGQYACDKIFNKPAGLDELLNAEDEEGGTVVNPDVTPEPSGDTDTDQDNKDDADQPADTGNGSDTDQEGGTGEAGEGETEGGETEGGETEGGDSTGGNEATDNAFGGKYKPIKVVVSDGGTMYVVSKGNHKGLIELSSDGSFTKFTGATKVKQTLSTLLRRILTDEQKAGSKLNLSTEYSNVCLDADGMIFGTINALEAADLFSHFNSKSEIGAAIKRIAPTGSDILVRNDVYPPSGDLGYYQERSEFSKMVDIAVASDGIYSALDSEKGRIFTYNNSGELLFIFGAKGSAEGAFAEPAAINILTFAAVEDGIIAPDDEEAETYTQMIIAVLDSKTARITLFKPTEYGKLIRRATMCQQNREYDEAVRLWEQVLDQASNSRLAYTGIGRIQYVRGEYESACENFMRAYNQSEYAEAYAKLRNERMEVAMPYIMTGIVVLVVFFVGKAIFKKIRRFIKTGGKGDE